MSILDWHRRLPVALSILYVVSILKGSRLECPTAQCCLVVITNEGRRERGDMSVLTFLLQ